MSSYVKEKCGVIGWPKDSKEFVFSMADGGHSASYIARQVFDKYGIHKTRNSVIGICHRAGKSLSGRISRQERASVYGSRPRLTHARKAPPKRELGKQGKILKLIFAETTPLPTAQETDIARVHIYELDKVPVYHTWTDESGVEHRVRTGHCRWPVGDPCDGMFCGEAKVPGLSYCKPHTARAYAPPTPKETRQLNKYIDRLHRTSVDPGRIIRDFRDLKVTQTA